NSSGMIICLSLCSYIYDPPSASILLGNQQIPLHIISTKTGKTLVERGIFGYSVSPNYRCTFVFYCWRLESCLCLRRAIDKWCQQFYFASNTVLYFDWNIDEFIRYY